MGTLALGPTMVDEGLLPEELIFGLSILGVKSFLNPIPANQKATDLNIFSLSMSDDVVTDIRFSSETSHGPSARLFGEIDHLERPAELARNGVEVASILVVLEPLQADLWDDERYARWTASVGASEAVVAVRMDQRSRRFGPDEVEARAAELGFPSAGASGNDVGDEGYRTAIFDAVAGEYELSALLELLEREREECRFEYDEEDYEADPRELDAAETELKWAERRRQLLAPRPIIEHFRRYELPAPLHNWDRRNSVQQWYFVASDEGIRYWQGGSGSSGQREDHGRWAHIFGALTVHHAVAIPTVVLRYDTNNVLRLVNQSPSLLVDAVDLVGNYGVGYEESRTLLEPFTINARQLLPDRDGLGG
jgi:hypothetical protein